MAEPKKLYLDKKNAKFLGVCAGIAKYFDMDPTVIRLIFLVLVFGFGTGVLAYFVLALILPQEPKKDAPEAEKV